MKRDEETTVRQALDNLHLATGLMGNWQPAINHRDYGVDGMLLLDLQNGKINFNAEIKREVRQHQLKQLLELANRFEPFIVIANHIYPAVKEKLRDHGIAYLDGAGNLYINHQEQLVWIDGNKLPVEEKKVLSRAFTKAGLKVLFLFLSNPDTLQMTYREIAGRAGVALGNINLVLAGLREGGYLLQMDKKRVILQNKKELLERWVTGYRETLKPALHLGNFRPMNSTADWGQFMLAEGDAWGGEPAANLLTKHLNPEILTIYTRGQKNELVKNLKLIPDATGDVQIYQKFWKDEESNNRMAPFLLIYTDLLLTDDPRCIETAALVYQDYLKYLTG